LQMSASWQVNTMIPSNGCRHILKSTDRWNWPETISAKTKALEESGRCGIIALWEVNLRFLNIYCGCKWQSHSTTLREAVWHQVPHLAELKFCYYVSCAIESALLHHDPNCTEGVEGLIETFHIYGLKYGCILLDNHPDRANDCLMVHAQPKHQWQHLIRSGWVASSLRWIQKIDLFGRYWSIQLDWLQC
jgi:hypothetical protein